MKRFLAPIAVMFGLGLPDLAWGDAPVFVVYACSNSGKSRSQWLKDSDPLGYDPGGNSVFSYVSRWMEIVDLGTNVDDGIDGHPQRDVDDNRVFSIGYEPAAKKHHFFLNHFDGDDEDSIGSWAEFAEQVDDEFTARIQDEVMQVKIRMKSGRRFVQSLREFRAYSWNNAFEYDELGDIVEYAGDDQYANFGHMEGAVVPTRLSPVRTVHIPQSISGPWYSYFSNSQTVTEYDEIAEEDVEVPGKYHQYDFGTDVCTYNATLTAIVNGAYGTLTDPVTGEVIPPGSRVYAVAAMVEYFRRVRYTAGFGYYGGGSY